MRQAIVWDNGAVKLIDQTQLPERCVKIRCTSVDEMWEAIRSLRVRGAPALGIAAAYGTCLGAQSIQATSPDEFCHAVERVTAKLATARPTARNLFWGLERMKRVLEAREDRDVAMMKGALLEEAHRIRDEDEALCRAIAEAGEPLVEQQDQILTHCNAGWLATARYGTALGVIYRAHERGKDVHVYIGETRPLLQGARLTTWELRDHGIPVTLICDNMVGAVMKSGKVSKVIVGADRIAANGDTANKIGTYAIAVLAKHHGIPFYVAAPSSTCDFSLPSGERIPIEERDPKEVTEGLGVRIAPRGVQVYNPAFDVTPHELITAFVTEHGVLYPPFDRSLKRCQA